MPPENQTSPAPVAPASFSPEPASSQQRKSPKRKLIIIIIAALVIIIIAVGLTLALGHKKNNSGQQSNNAYYYNRPGYKKSDLSTGTGDPEALKPVTNATPVNYAGSPVVQACNVLSLDTLHQVNLHLYANPLATIMTRTFFDGKGLATLPVDPYSLPEDSSTNYCLYDLEDGLTTSIDIYQPGYVPASAVQDEISRNYQQQADVNGVHVYTYTPSGYQEYYYMLQSGNTYAQFLVVGADHATDNAQQMAQKLLPVVAKNLQQEVAHPTGPAKMTYDSPVFQKSYANGCDLTGNSDFKGIYGVDASPLAIEKLSSGPGVINFHDNGGPDINYNYIDNSCERTSIINGVNTDSSGNASIEQTYFFVNTESYLNSAPATLDFASDKQSGQGSTPINGIGDEAMFSNQAALDDALTFREGRFIVQLSLVEPGTAPTMSTQETIQKLTPVAQKIAGELKNQ